MAWKPALAVVLVVALPAAPALGERIAGTKGPDELDGTRKADTLRGRGGDDVILGRRGDDVLIGGRGSDVLVGGRGEDRCVTDAADDPPSKCEDVTGPAGPLVLDAATGTDRCLILRRADLCYFVLEGSGADAATGAITASGAVTLTSEPGRVAARKGAWTANGTYACEGDGALAVAIGDESVTAPVDCRGV